MNHDHRRTQLRRVVDAYFGALRSGRFDDIPFHENATLRAPLAPGGVHVPLKGRSTLMREWWTPLQPALSGLDVKIHDYYYNESLTAVVTEADVIINAFSPPVVLRVADRFTVDDEGRITEQENHFDPRDVTNPGWNTGR